MMTDKEVLARLQDVNLLKLSKFVDIGYHSILRFKNGGSPTYRTVKLLSDRFQLIDARIAERVIESACLNEVMDANRQA